jgi:hypothetical protein
VVLQQVQVYSKDIAPNRFTGLLNEWYAIPKNLVLPHDENHLTFSFRCPSYLNSESILYQYQLEGMENHIRPDAESLRGISCASTRTLYIQSRGFPAGAWILSKNVDFSLI